MDLMIPVDHHRALALYYEKYMECRFFLNGEPCDTNEVFHHAGFLPVIVEEASRLSMMAFNQKIDLQLIDRPDALLGKEVVLEDDIRQPVVFMLVRAADVIFGAAKGGDIELLPIFSYYRKPTSQRGLAPWRANGRVVS